MTNRNSSLRSLLPLLFGAMLLGALLVPNTLFAQQGGITGVVTVAGTGEPLKSATIQIPALDRGTLAGPDGSFRFADVPGGTYRVTANLLGYSQDSRQVTVTAGEMSRVEFALSPSAVEIRDIVVTGTGQAVERRAVGNVIETVRVDEAESASAQRISDIIKDKVPGMTTMVPSGSSVASTSFRLRGSVSVSQSNEPLIYIDGVRINSEPDTIGALPFTLTAIDHIDPEIVERVEVIKGAAATTLYGTEASSGVIQIFTKKGYEGDPRVNVSVTQGLTSLPKNRLEVPTVYSGGEILTSDPRDVVLRTGHIQRYRGSIRGGAASTSYYGSIGYDDTKGGQIGDAYNRYTGRLQLSHDFSSSFQGTIHAGYTYSDFDIPGSRKDPVGTIANAQLALPQAKSEERPYGEIFVPLANARQIERNLRDQLFIGGASLSYAFSSEINAQFTAGTQIRDTEAVYFEPFGVNIEGSTDGEKRLDEGFDTFVTLDLKTHWNREFSEDLTSSFTVGGQTFIDDRSSSFVAVESFPATGITTIGSASTVIGYGERQTEEVSAGVFAQERLGYKDRLFLTAGVRLDGHSSFGEEFGLQVYPKASMSYVISDEGFWNVSFVESLKLRAAFGTSGLAPGPFSAQRSFTGDAYDGESAAVPDNLGQPDLKPEVSREFEVGFDASLLSGRLGLNVTYFDQKTEDALVPRAFPPSRGFLQPQLINAGTLENKGLETSLEATVLDDDGIRVDLNGSLSSVSSIADLGGAAPIRPGYQSYINYLISGYAPGSYFGERLDPQNPYDIIVGDQVNPDDLSGFNSVDQVRINLLQNAAGGDSLAFLGSPDPDVFGNFGMNVQLGDALSLASSLSWQVGGHAFNRTARIYSQLGIDRRIAEIAQQLDDAATSNAEREQLAADYARLHTGAAENFVESNDFIRLNRVAATYEFSSDVATKLFGATGLRAVLTGENLGLWTDYSGTDPITNEAGSTNFVRNTDFFQAPVARRITLSLQATF